MQGKDDLEFLVALIQEYTNNMPQATKLAVTKHAQACVDGVYKVLEGYQHFTEIAPAEITPEPQLLTEAE